MGLCRRARLTPCRGGVVQPLTIRAPPPNDRRASDCSMRDLSQSMVSPGLTRPSCAMFAVECRCHRYVRSDVSRCDLVCRRKWIGTEPALAIEELAAHPIRLQAFIMTLSHSRMWAAVWNLQPAPIRGITRTDSPYKRGHFREQVNAPSGNWSERRASFRR
jgi:hypothetical protein